jgi:hypothetical protein
MRFPWRVTVLVLGAACASSPPAARQPGAAPSPRPTMDPGRIEPGRSLRVEYPRGGGAIQHYAFVRRDSVIATMPTGETQVQLLGRTAYLTLTWVATDTGARLTSQVDSLVADTGLVSFSASLDSARGLRWTALRQPSGRLTGLSTGRGSLVGDQLRDQLELLFPILPTDGARPGITWNDSTSMSTRVSAFEATETARSSSTAAMPANGTNALDLTVIRVRQASGDGTQFNQPMTLQATGLDSLTYRLAPDGRVIDVIGRRTTDLVVQLPSIGQQVPAHEASYLRMTLLP